MVCSAVVVSGELCEFPSDHPMQALESGETVPVLEMENNRVYIYTDQFESCHGCVRSLRFCYLPNSDELMTIEIRSPGGVLRDSHIVTVDAANDIANCADTDGLDHAFCCVEQILTEPFVVGSQNWHYRLRFGNVASLLLRHQNETVAGRQEDLNGGVIEDTVYKPLFYFTIDPDDGRSLNQLHVLQYDYSFTDDCSNIPSTTPSSTTPAATASESTTESTTETADATVSTTESTTETVGRWCFMHKGNVNDSYYKHFHCFSDASTERST